MIDALYSRYSLRKQKPLDPNYKPSDAIAGRRIINKQSKKLAVIFPGWHNHPEQVPVNRLVKRLRRKGWTVLVYDFHDQILQPADRTVVESFHYIRDFIVDDLTATISASEYDEVRFISISMGGVILALVADRFPHFTGATAAVGGDNLAIDMWHGMRTLVYAEEFQKMHLGVRKLAKEWYDLAPEHHLRHFKGKPVKLVMSKHDRFVLTEYQEKLKDQLESVGADVKVKRHWPGHVLTVLMFAFFDSPL